MTSPPAANAEGLLAIGKPRRALGVIEAGLASAPSDRNLHFLRVQALMMLGRPVEAMSAAEGLLANQPNWARAHWVYGLAVTNRWHLRPARIRSRAVPAAEEAIRLSPLQAESHYFLAYCLVRSVRHLAWHGSVLDRARAAALRALELAPRWVPPLLLLAQIERAARNRREASEYAERALELDPTDSQTLLSAINHAPLARRRTLVRRLAAIDPSHTATDLVLRTHRPLPRWVVVGSSVMLGFSAFVADLVNFGELPRGSSALWVLGPLASAVAVATAMGWRREQLQSFDQEVRTVVMAAERRSRWPRRMVLALVMVLPVAWLPATIVGDHPSAWSVGWVVAGVAVVLLARPRFNLVSAPSG